ncbi:uncharacterized protein LOC130648640 [Hydractinia symbiolongicarpus]|uniref:uncharacterized protein LOC130648640 n=1 Tax=Hydractinia symbiolongicarpus TaxID=13093 RepID=UPI00255046E5|nr:uncharacterized protein LOC130648640 [Hydractinia symbiolongicarpus]
MINFPCGVCGKSVNSNHKAIQCDICKFWIHIKCNGLNADDYISLQNSDELWFCCKCINKILPFGSTTPPLVYDKSLSSMEMKRFLSQLNSIEINEVPHPETMGGVNCKYYDPIEFSALQVNSDKFSLFHMNIASLSKHIDELKILLGQLGHDFSVIGITETKFQTKIPPINCDLSGYSFTHTPTEGEKGGALLYIPNHLQFIERPDLDTLAYKSKELESKFIEIIRAKDRNMIVGCIYRHPSMSVDEFNNHFLLPLLEKASSDNKSIFLLGDFNIDLLKSETVKEVSDYIDITSQFNLLPHIILPTRVTEVSSTIIDNIYFSSAKWDTVSGNIISSISDHFPQFLVLKNLSAINPLHTSDDIFVHDWKKFHHNDFLTELHNKNWDDILQLNVDDPNLAFNNFYNCINSLLVNHAPLKKTCNKKRKKKSNPWITNGILTSIIKRDHLHKCFLREKDPLLKSSLLESFKKYRNKIVSLCRMSKSNFLNKYFSNNQKNIGNIWKGVKNIISVRSSVSASPTCMNINNSVVTDPVTIANSFNDYFASIADNIRMNIPFTRKHFSSFLKKSTSNSMFLSPTDDLEVLHCISSLDPGKSSGPFSIPAHILTLVKSELSIPLSKLINLSFTTGIFPTNLKTAKTIPIYKKGSKLELTNYRPISLLSNIDKIYEKIIYKRVYGFLEANNALYKHQFGFRKNYSTSQTLLNISQKIMDALDKGNYACGVFIDLQKAFDTVDHEILLKKLFHYGIRGTPLSLFKSYLTGRQQFVSINGNISTSNLIRHGVPQGSVLGPLLFLIYINDLHCSINFSLVHHFADDTNLLNFSKSLKQLAKQMNFDLKLLCHWLNANKISLNASKTEYIVFKHTRKPLNYDFRLFINGKRLIPSNCIKYLGVLLDSDLSWKSQINDTVAKLKRANGALAKLRHFVPLNVLILVYYAIFHSHLLMSFESRRASSSHLYGNLELLKFSDIVKCHNILFLHKLFHEKLPASILNTFAVDFTHAQGTRAEKIGLINLPTFNTISFGKNSIRFNAINSWNKLQSLMTRKFVSLDYFNLRSDLKKYFVSSY